MFLGPTLAGWFCIWLTHASLTASARILGDDAMAGPSLLVFDMAWALLGWAGLAVLLVRRSSLAAPAHPARESRIP
jgi:hypothetical protein